MPLTPESTLGRYRLLERIGAGGMGEVWKAHDANLDREVAIKVLMGGALEDTTTRERFRREAHVLSRLSHPGVATIFDFDTQDGTDFLVMEYVPGGTLQARLAAGRCPSTNRCGSARPWPRRCTTRTSAASCTAT